MKIGSLLILAVCLGGCATVTRGTTNQVTFESEPAEASVTTTSGQVCQSTPCVLEISRKTEFAATFSKPGYHDETIKVETRVAGAGAAGFAGNILVGGIIGLGVDAATGSTLEHQPNPVKAELRPLKPARKHIRSRKIVASPNS